MPLTKMNEKAVLFKLIALKTDFRILESAPDIDSLNKIAQL